MLRKLLLRFPNLQSVYFKQSSSVLLKLFDDQLCQELLQSCPKLATFDIAEPIELDAEMSRYYKVLRKLRLLVTTVNAQWARESDNVTDIITSSPRLKSIKGLSNFAACLPLVEQLSCVKELKVISGSADNTKFAQNYLASKPEEVRDLLVKKLSQIDKLTWHSKYSSSVNSMKFITDYLTGVTYYEIHCILTHPWASQNEQRVCNSALELVRSTHNNSKLYLPLPPRKPPGKHVSFAIDEMEIDTFQLSLSGPSEGGSTMYFESQRPKHLNFVAPAYSSLYRLTTSLFPKYTSWATIDELIFTIPMLQHSHHKPSQAEHFEVMFNAMPSLKKATLDVPMYFSEARTKKGLKPICPQLESFTLRATPNGSLQTLLNNSAYTFPNIKHLKLLYFCGRWKDQVGDFQMELGKYSLEKLTLDVTPVKRAMMKRLQEKQLTKNDFFLILVEFLKDGGRHMYKVSFDLSSITKVVDSDLIGYTRSEDYLRVSFTMTDLKQLELYMYRYGSPREQDNII